VFRLSIHEDAVADLQAIWAAGDARSFGVIRMFLQLAKSDQQILESLASDFFGFDGVSNFNVRKWIAQQNRGRNLWRVRLCDIKGLDVPHRILHAFNPANRTYYVLAIMDRGINYDESSTRIRRLLAVYDSLGISGVR
jgi:hypothetical protein